MHAIEFTTELTNSANLKIPVDIASQLPKTGRVRVIVLTDEPADAEWQAGAYERFLREDSEEDAIDESLRLVCSAKSLSANFHFHRGPAAKFARHSHYLTFSGMP
ncbi:MAG: hypothetical protein PHE55_07145 [Methylococcaceae bacterium]|nr:hypothetical protein [Methylococcaceae bacterium]